MLMPRRWCCSGCGPTDSLCCRAGTGPTASSPSDTLLSLHTAQDFVSSQSQLGLGRQLKGQGCCRLAAVAILGELR